jgi:hypothetical protein
MREHPLADPAADPLATERGTRRWTTRRIGLLAAGILGAAAFAYGATHMAAESSKGPGEAPPSQGEMAAGVER